MNEEIHKPVLVEQVLSALQPQAGESYLDLTAGYGGHASEILAITRSQKDARTVLVDRDDFAVDYLTQKFGTEAEIRHESFYDAALSLTNSGVKFDIILADLGVSSPQLDNSERGFSFRAEGPLDMRMDKTLKLTAERILNKWREKEISAVFEKYGEISPRAAARTAKMIVHHRPWQTTTQLATAIAGTDDWHGKHHPATQYFQALRIMVNDELGQLEKTLELIPGLLNPRGRVGIITFHSLEDRIVKNFFRNETSKGEESELEILTKKPLVAEKSELVINPRARSAKLRAARRRN